MVPPLTAINLAIASGSGSLVDNGNGTWSYHAGAQRRHLGDVLLRGDRRRRGGGGDRRSLDITPVNDAPVTTPVTLAAIAEDSGARLITQAELLPNATRRRRAVALTAINLAIASGNGALVDNGNGTWSYHAGAQRRHLGDVQLQRDGRGYAGYDVGEPRHH